MKNTSLPNIMMITGSYNQNPDSFLKKLRHALKTNNIPLVQLRIKGIAEDEYSRIAYEAIKLCHQANSQMIVNCNLDLAEKLNADGVHLTGKLLRTFKRTDSTYKKSISASCHNKEELIMANEKRIDFATLSPVLPPSYKPDANTLGWQKFSDLLPFAHCPIFALGGLTVNDLNQAQHMGAHGIASISSFWE